VAVATTAAGTGSTADPDTTPAAAPAPARPRPAARNWVLPVTLAVLLAAGAAAVSAFTVSRRRSHR
jgi:hypothetical protein